MNSTEIETVLVSLDNQRQVHLLLAYGHWLTILARDAYEFQGPGVVKPRLLRDVNEISHGVYPKISELLNNLESSVSVEGISFWIAAEERNDEIRTASVEVFKRAFGKTNT